MCWSGIFILVVDINLIVWDGVLGMWIIIVVSWVNLNQWFDIEIVINLIVIMGVDCDVDGIYLLFDLDDMVVLDFGGIYIVISLLLIVLSCVEWVYINFKNVGMVLSMSGLWFDFGGGMLMVGWGEYWYMYDLFVENVNCFQCQYLSNIVINVFLNGFMDLYLKCVVFMQMLNYWLCGNICGSCWSFEYVFIIYVVIGGFLMLFDNNGNDCILVGGFDDMGGNFWCIWRDNLLLG